MPKIASTSGGARLDQSGLREAVSDEIASSYVSGTAEQIGAAGAVDGSLVRVARLEEPGGCGLRVADRISVGAELTKATDPAGQVQIEIRSRDGLATRKLFVGLFTLSNRAPEWLVTVTGQPAEEFEIHVSFVSNTPGNTAHIRLAAIVDRAGGPVGTGSNAPDIQVNEDALDQQTFPAPSATNAGVASVVVAAYNANPDVTMAAPPDEAAFANLDPAAVIWVSYDGVTDHFKLDPATPTASIVLPTHELEWWFRLDVAGAADLQYVVSRVRPL